MDTRLIVPLGGGVGLVYCAYMMVEAMNEEGWTAWGIAAMTAMSLAALAAFYIAWKRNKEIKAEQKRDED